MANLVNLYVFNAWRVSYLDFTCSRVKRLKKMTLDITNHGHLWCCKKKNGLKSSIKLTSNNF